MEHIELQHKVYELMRKGFVKETHTLCHPCVTHSQKGWQLEDVNRQPSQQ